MRSNGKTAPNKRLALLAGYDYVAGSRKRANPERRLDSLKFKIHKFNNRTRPTDKSKILVVPTFYEFGVETIGLSFCLPQIIHKNPDRYVILVGWYGRSYLYSRIADEYWELDEEHQWLREYSDAFKNESRNISRLQGKLSNVGTVVPGDAMAQLMFKIADEQAPDILQYNPNLPQALVAFLDRTMTKEVAERLQNGDTFAAAL